MRTIKFRAWSIPLQRMIPQPRYAFHNPEKIFMQFTGLHDKNGKEIYEGDIVMKMEHDYGSPEWEAYIESGYELPEPKPTIEKKDVVSLDIFRFWLRNETFGYEGEELQDPERWEVISNIYENPELLNR